MVGAREGGRENGVEKSVAAFGKNRECPPEKPLVLEEACRRRFRWCPTRRPQEGFEGGGTRDVIYTLFFVVFRHTGGGGV